MRRGYSRGMRPFGRVQRWSGVSGTFRLEYDEENPLQIEIPNAPAQGEIEAPFKSSGYSDPGKLSGAPEDCYPPESEDERNPDGVATLYYTDAEGKTQHFDLTPEQTSDLFEVYCEDIDSVELDSSCDDYDDCRDDYDDCRDSYDDY